MATTNEKLTRENEQTETSSRMQTRQEVLGRISQHDELISEMGGLPNGWGDGYPYIPFKDLIIKCKLTERDGLDLLQMLGCKGPDGNWAKAIIETGIVFNLPHQGYDREFDVVTRYNPEVCSPHGHRFFEELFTGIRSN